MKNEITLSRCLFTPFRYIAGFRSLYIGLGVMLLLSLLGYWGGTYFDGLIDTHYASSGVNTHPYPIHLAMQVISWVVVTLICYLSARIFSDSRIRPVDFAGTLSMARIPLIIFALIGFFPGLHPSLPGADPNQINIGEMMTFLQEHILSIVVIAVLGILVIAWYIALLYNAYSVSGNLRGARGIRSFIVSLILSEAIAFVAIHALL